LPRELYEDTLSKRERERERERLALGVEQNVGVCEEGSVWKKMWLDGRDVHIEKG
jgi:hypothetical protein